MPLCRKDGIGTKLEAPDIASATLPVRSEHELAIRPPNYNLDGVVATEANLFEPLVNEAAAPGIVIRGPNLADVVDEGHRVVGGSRGTAGSAASFFSSSLRSFRYATRSRWSHR